jgi:ubiquinone/menaquinone biosynthesis C-methylase UbiE
VAVSQSGRDIGPNRRLAVEKYRRLADRYDRLAPLTASLRRHAVERLKLAKGDTVVDVACGTGLSFAQIEERIGETGALMGIELSPEMLAKARRRAAEHGWDNVTLIEAAAEEAQLPARADAALFVLTHDVMRSPLALRNVISQLKPGARIAVAGAKRPPWWAVPVSLYVAYAARRYLTTREGLERPWSFLSGLVPDLQIRELSLGGAYLAWGTAPGERLLPDGAGEAA